jgi:Icc-related predicted phosphoesterase
VFEGADKVIVRAVWLMAEASRRAGVPSVSGGAAQTVSRSGRRLCQGLAASGERRRAGEVVHRNRNQVRGRCVLGRRRANGQRLCEDGRSDDAGAQRGPQDPVRRHSFGSRYHKGVPLKLLVFSDIHNDWKALERLLAIEADVYIAAGDQVSWEKGLDRCGEILAARGDRLYVLPGNHEKAEQIARMCERHGLNDLHERSIQLGRWHVAGLGYSGPTPFQTPGEYTEAGLAQRLERFAELKPLVLVCHAPPYGTALDQIRPGTHAGSTAVRDFIAKAQPAYFFCGHIHEAEGAAIEMGRTRCWNVGKKGYLLELD